MSDAKTVRDQKFALVQKLLLIAAESPSDAERATAREKAAVLLRELNTTPNTKENGR